MQHLCDFNLRNSKGSGNNEQDDVESGHAIPPSFPQCWFFVLVSCLVGVSLATVANIRRLGVSRSSKESIVRLEK
ncbi:hypothetical protein Acr_21g0003130 [Actinidia rufa]|uniref:Uncharacterized protein n=1 Tax=Actinidia rufa TaxID=165716 RepID=A0A7J0GG19_9ERIC|nr:hypothetical protein Acr_21g0003130 [Actinidia rufa]